MSPDPERLPPVERFAADSLIFDLAGEIAALRAEAAPASHGRRQKTLFKCGGRTVALFVLEPGAGLAEHATKGTVTVEVIEGALMATVGGEERRLDTGMMLVMHPSVPHAIAALGAVAFLLQVSLEPSSPSR